MSVRGRAPSAPSPLVIAAIVVCGCAVSHGAGDEDAGVRDALTIEEYAEALGRLTCERIVWCAGGSDNNAWLEAAPDVACETLFPSWERADVERAAARGTIRFDPEAARRCLDVRARSCHFPAATLDACAGVITGTVPEGAECRAHVECEPGTFCDAPVDVARCGGTCRPRIARGGPCVPGCSQCWADRCADVVEVVAAGDGEPCGLAPGPVRDTVISRVCGPDLYCIDTCRPFPGIGEPCDPTVHPVCSGALACVGGICTERRVELREGAPCGETVLCNRLHRLICEAGACVRIGGGVGARCVAPWGDLDCDPGTRCDFTTERCAPAPGDPPPECAP